MGHFAVEGGFAWPSGCGQLLDFEVGGGHGAVLGVLRLRANASWLGFTGLIGNILALVPFAEWIKQNLEPEENQCFLVILSREGWGSTIYQIKSSNTGSSASWLCLSLLPAAHKGTWLFGGHGTILPKPGFVHEKNGHFPLRGGVTLLMTNGPTI